MRIYRFRKGRANHYGILKEDILYTVDGSIFRSFSTKKTGIPISDVILLPPIEPTKIIAVGANYRDHAAERRRKIPKEPLLFMKPPSAVVGPNDIIVYPSMAQRVDFEGELAVVIKKKVYGLKEDSLLDDIILGYTCFNDVTARDLQDKDVQFTRAKSFDTFAPIGPCIVTGIDPSNLRVKTFLNGKLRQSGNTKNMIFSVPYLVRFVSNIMTLNPGDIITTGTPAGIGPMQAGDRVDIQIEKIGTLSNTVMKVK